MSDEGNWFVQFEKSYKKQNVDGYDYEGFSKSLESAVDMLEEVQQLEMHTTNFILANSYLSLYEKLNAASSFTKSPIEKALLHALIIRGIDKAQRVNVSNGLEKIPYKFGEITYCNKLSIVSQYQVGNYKVDFFILYEDIFHQSIAESNRFPLSIFKIPSLIVECDGHDFHERTKQQISNDKKREREIQKLKSEIPIFRFSGSDIWKDVFAVADEILNYLVSENLKIDQKIFKYHKKK